MDNKRPIKRALVEAEHEDGKSSKLYHKKTKELLWIADGYESLRDMWWKYNEMMERDK